MIFFLLHSTGEWLGYVICRADELEGVHRFMEAKGGGGGGGGAGG